ncbi:MAG TPA: flippase-like domain-containing protein, partial [Candidatus Aenigmarchaeota archaeon]|nr:flippase-like domain-containing protein [Candidatus Aenigmarchaeota archaeon]
MKRKIKIIIPYKKILISLILGILSIFALYTLFENLRQSFSLILSVNLPVYLLAILISISAFHMYIISWTFLLKALKIKIRFRHVVSLVWTSYFFDAMIPTGSVSGEVIRAYLTSRKYGAKLADAMSSVVAHRIVAISSFLIMGLITFISLFLLFHLSQQILILCGIMLSLSLFALIVLTYLSLKPKAINKLLKVILRICKKLSRKAEKKIKRWEPRVSQAVQEFSKGMKLLITHKKTMILTFLTSIIWWLGNAFVGYIIFLSLGYRINFFLILFVFTITILVRMIPIFIPGSMGLFEAVTIGLWSSLKVST